MDERMYESIFDKLVRHGYIFIEKELIPSVLTMVSKEGRFGNYVREKGIKINQESESSLVKFTIIDWMPYSSNILGESI